jgi:P pilus assembly chaperone PapD
VLAGLACCLGATPVTVWAQLEADRLEVFLTAGPGAVQGTFTIRNVTDQQVTSQLSIGDWTRAIDGTNNFSDTGGTMVGSCHPTLTIFPTILRLAPRQSQAVTVTYSGGTRASSCWSIIFVGSAPQPATSQGGAQITVELRQGIKIYVQPPGMRPDLQVDTVGAARHKPMRSESPADTVGTDIVAIVRNPGAIQSRVKGRLEYRTLNDSVVTQRVIAEFPVLPGARRRVESQIPRLPPGHYVVIVIFDYGGPELVAGQIEIDVAR